MNTAILDSSGQLDATEFFAPSQFDMVDQVVAEHCAIRKSLEQTAEFMSSKQMATALTYFGRANMHSRDWLPSADRLFELEPALAALDASFWDRALDMIDVRDYMPAERRKEWQRQIESNECPPFTEDNLRSTMEGLLAMRSKFLAEMVDGLFRGLSREHITNRPEGFGKRFILRWVYGSWGAGHDADYIHDLRCIIAKFMGSGTPSHGATKSDIEVFRRNSGEWHTWDGGALRCRVYKKGTGHLEVHPEIAVRLNQILAYLYPAAIPEKHRKAQKASRAKRETALVMDVVPFEVRYEMRRLEHRSGTKEVRFHYSNSKDKHLREKVEQILLFIGGVEDGNVWRFDYPPSEIISEVIASGLLPDRVTHQFYPTPDELAQRAVEMAAIQPDDLCLEPSAGQGAIAAHMPSDRTTCVEVSELNCNILKAKGHQVIQADFLEHDAGTFDVIVMNPPYSQGRWQAHVEKAAKHLNHGGRMVAILPASAAKSFDLDHFDISWSSVLVRPFAGVSIDIVLMKAIRTNESMKTTTSREAA